MSKCRLCLSRTADKLNSHIIPKFLGKRLFESSPNRHTIIFSRITQKYHKAQDTPKEDNIFCTQCEKRFEIIKTYFSKRITELYSFEKFPSKFILGQITTQEYLICNFKPELFFLFIYSMIWRVSVSQLHEYKDYKLPIPIEDKIRTLLNKYLGYNHKQLLNINYSTDWDIESVACLIKPKVFNDETRGLLLAYQSSPISYLLFMSEFILFFYPNENNSEFAHRNFNLMPNSKILIPLANTEQWKLIKQVILNKIIAKGP